MNADSASTRLAPTQFVQQWAEAMAQVLGEISGAPLPAAVLSEPLSDVPGAGDDDLWIVGSCSGALRGEISLCVPVPSAVHLAKVFLNEAAVTAGEFSADHRAAVLELLHQANSRFIASVHPVWGEVQIRLELLASPPSWPAASTAWLRFGEDASAPLLELQLSAALVAALAAENPAVASSPNAVDPAASQVDELLRQHDDKVNLQALLDVQLGVSLRFGSRRLLLREILDLNPGAVIELDRQVQEPVDMLLDGRVVARGEIVVIDGNYGLRVTEVARGSQ